MKNITLDMTKASCFLAEGAGILRLTLQRPPAFWQKVL